MFVLCINSKCYWKAIYIMHSADDNCSKCRELHVEVTAPSIVNSITTLGVAQRSY